MFVYVFGNYLVAKAKHFSQLNSLSLSSRIDQNRFWRQNCLRKEIFQNAQNFLTNAM